MNRRVYEGYGCESDWNNARKRMRRSPLGQRERKLRETRKQELERLLRAGL